ncbi:histidinol-phosphate aminotransferase [Pelagirhabdus alkalitolerans]|uniref:Histidinol-phosphate aminotransferase n=1 Tax=Pelagirhabdus alkalitolerans TaxID=1612202 RepID=A0A1G6HAF1_9BACI|nr:histidinol-phosphate transaminase [Pelagirhabdus alkalitolerans]SDB91267.1 histidinol-phosphate aminotransferase [Pelagirhabdus alkalitolerans]
MKAKKVFESMTPYKPGKQIEEVKKEYGLDRIVKLASNENPFGYSKKVDEVIQHAAKSFEIYPDGYATDLRQLLSDALSVLPDQLVFGCGSDEIIDMICRTYLEEGSNTIMATPTFPQYKHNAMIQGADIKEIPLINGYHDLQGMLDAVDENTNVVWLCTPNNPTGCMINDQSLKLFMDKCPEDVLVVLDEAYYEYISSHEAPDALELLKTYNNLIVLRTFSKAYGIAGLRVGYGISNLEISEALNIARGPFNTTDVGQKAAIAAFKDQEFLEQTRKETLNNKIDMINFCDEMELGYFDSETNFLFIKLPVSGDLLFNYLLSKGFIVRSGVALGFPNGVRLTIGAKEDMQELQTHMRNFLNEHAKETEV